MRRAPSVAPAEDRFGYARRLAPPVGVLLGLALIEAAVVHLVAVAWAGWRWAVALGAVDAVLVLVLASLLRSFERRPVTLDDEWLVMRAGWRTTLPIPVDFIDGFRATWTVADLKMRGTANLALVAWPNTVLELRRPVMRRGRAVHRVAHCLDDPAAFRARLEPLLARRAAGSPAPAALKGDHD